MLAKAQLSLGGIEMEIQDKIYTFLFHPLAEEHSTSIKILAVVTDIALSIFTGGLFLLALGMIQLKDRDIEIQRQSTPASTIAKKVLMENAGVSISPAEKKAKTIKDKQAEQLKQFEAWAAKNDWQTFHASHYDWWMFPITRDSQGQGNTYTLDAESTRLLKNDPEFMQNFRRGVELVARSWGWEVKNSQLTDHPTADQKWANWPVRLGKMADSMKLFDQKDDLESMKNYAIQHTPYQSFEGWIKKALGIPLK